MNFGLTVASLAIIFLVSESALSQGGGRRVRLSDSELTIGLPPNWRTAEKKPGHEESLGAFQSQDNTSSVFVSVANARANADMTQILEGAVRNFETAFIVREVGEFKTGKLADSIAIFTTLEADLRSAKGSETMAFRFYLAIFDTGKSLYLFQGSVQAPVKPEREKEILAMLRSLQKIN